MTHRLFTIGEQKANVRGPVDGDRRTASTQQGSPPLPVGGSTGVPGPT
ncbi:MULTISPECIES: hypothetical protein [Micrococcaceae]|nr:MULTISPECIES: hypothetical protein [Micrococcaceae]